MVGAGAVVVSGPVVVGATVVGATVVGAADVVVSAIVVVDSSTTLDEVDASTALDADDVPGELFSLVEAHAPTRIVEVRRRQVVDRRMAAR